MIFSWNNADPMTGISDASYHGPNQRFTRSVIFRDYKNETLAEQEIMPNDYRTLNVTMENVGDYFQCFKNFSMFYFYFKGSCSK